MMSLPDRLVLECPEHYSDMADQLDTEEEEGHKQTNGGTGGGGDHIIRHSAFGIFLHPLVISLCQQG